MKLATFRKRYEGAPLDDRDLANAAIGVADHDIALAALRYLDALQEWEDMLDAIKFERG